MNLTKFLYDTSKEVERLAKEANTAHSRQGEAQGDTNPYLGEERIIVTVVAIMTGIVVFCLVMNWIIGIMGWGKLPN